MCEKNDIPANLYAEVDDNGHLFYKTYYIMCKIDTGFDYSTSYVAQFFKKDAAYDYVEFLNEGLCGTGDLFVNFYVEEDELYEKK